MCGRLKIIWLIAASMSVLIGSIVSGAEPISTITSVLGILFVVGAAFGHSVTNLFGALFNLCLLFVSYRAGFFGNVVMAGTIFFAHLYGWYFWYQNQDIMGVVTKRSMTVKNRVIVSMMFIVASVTSICFSYTAGSSMWFLDGLTAVIPLFATYLLINAYKEQWLLWIPFNILAFIMWYVAAKASPEFVPLMIMKMVFLLNSFIGNAEWNRET